MHAQKCMHQVYLDFVETEVSEVFVLLCFLGNNIDLCDRVFVLNIYKKTKMLKVLQEVFFLQCKTKLTFIYF